MSLSPSPTLLEPTIPENDSDYGDFADDAEELEIVNQLLQQLESKQHQNASLAITDIEDYEPPRGIRLPRVLGQAQTRQWDQSPILRDGQTKTAEVRKDTPEEDPKPIEPTPAPEPDTRSPLERFRRPPKKALSVTDLVSPSWCELQYFYTLSKHGRKRRTPAMKQGTKVHQALEDEVHITVPVEVTKLEDSWGLRIWNIVQGLRTLRETGRTRELEIWGTVGGEIVNGIIDEIGYECPDPELEKRHDSALGKNKEPPALPEYQTSITDYLVSGAQKENGQSLSNALSGTLKVTAKQTPPKRIYITDVKTRGSPTLPTGSSIRPTILQLHLYHHMLENLAQGNFSLVQLAERYGLDVNETFSDAFIAQIGHLNQDLVTTMSSSQENTATLQSSQDSIDILLQHNNLSSLWAYMISQFRQTFITPPIPSSDRNESPTPTPQSLSDLPVPTNDDEPQPTRLSPILTAEYLAPTYKHIAGTAKKSLGQKTFIFNPQFLKSYLEDTLSWWRGEREAKGVELHEAWKCRSCDFRDDCEWIHERDKEALRLVVERKKIRGTDRMEKDVDMDVDAGVEESGESGERGGGMSKSKV